MFRTIKEWSRQSAEPSAAWRSFSGWQFFFLLLLLLLLHKGKTGEAAPSQWWWRNRRSREDESPANEAALLLCLALPPSSCPHVMHVSSSPSPILCAHWCLYWWVHVCEAHVNCKEGQPFAPSATSSGGLVGMVAWLMLPVDEAIKTQIFNSPALTHSLTTHSLGWSEIVGKEV